jgi:splicing factor 3A subunit 1
MSEGIILPPFELRRLIDKAAEFVAKNGANFESMLIKAEINNPKFSFFSIEDIYHAYYRQKLQELTPKSNLVISYGAGR